MPTNKGNNMGKLTANVKKFYEQVDDMIAYGWNVSVSHDASGFLAITSDGGTGVQTVGLIFCNYTDEDSGTYEQPVEVYLTKDNLKLISHVLGLEKTGLTTISMGH